MRPVHMIPQGEQIPIWLGKEVRSRPPLPAEPGKRVASHPAQATGRTFQVSDGAPWDWCSRVTSTLGLWLKLLGGIGLKADGRDEVQLGLQPLNVFLALDDQVLEELPCAGIALLEAEGDRFFKREQGA